jgi:Protein required for attachment to host cells
LKAYHTRESSLRHRKKADLIKKITYTKAHTKLSDLLTDTKGTFRGSGDAKSPRRGSGEAHHMKTEMLTKSMRGLAHDIEGIISNTPADEYYLSLPKAIQKGVTGELKKNIHSQITKQLGLDLTKDNIEDIRKRFKV